MSYKQKSTKKITAQGEYLILRASAEAAGTEIVSPSGIVLGVRETGEIPKTCTIYSIGSEVPEGTFTEGQVAGIPEGNIRNVIHPDVIEGFVDVKDCPEKFILCHYKSIGVIYS